MSLKQYRNIVWGVRVESALSWPAAFTIGLLIATKWKNALQVNDVVDLQNTLIVVTKDRRLFVYAEFFLNKKSNLNVHRVRSGLISV